MDGGGGGGSAAVVALLHPVRRARTKHGRPGLSCMSEPPTALEDARAAADLRSYLERIRYFPDISDEPALKGFVTYHIRTK